MVVGVGIAVSGVAPMKKRALFAGIRRDARSVNCDAYSFM